MLEFAVELISFLLGLSLVLNAVEALLESLMAEIRRSYALARKERF